MTTTALSRLPWRGPGGGRPELPLPPGEMPLRFNGAWRKRWRYVSAFGEECMICAARVQVGVAHQTFWAVWDRERGELHERTRVRAPWSRGEVRDGGRRLGAPGAGPVTGVDSNGVRAEIRTGDGAWAESICPTPEGAYVWTRKRVAPVEVEVSLPGGRRIRASMRGVEDESAGYHPRHTVWSWSAGVGVAADGRAVGWNLVTGVNDPPAGSERALWVEGEKVPREPGPVAFDALDAIAFDDGSRLAFSKEAERARRDNKLFVRSAYRQPFGTFHGSLAGIELREGFGVMEHHDAVW